MQYMLLIYGTDQAITQEVMEADMPAYNAFGEEARARNLMVGGEALHPVSTATTVRIRDGKPIATDGPFAETKEVLGGYYILNCKDLDEAIEMAGKLVVIGNSAVEIRPVVDFSQYA
ncbi:MAG: YciI family protein [Chloroflexi bacterium]|nr:YciI family protein [Chloroflexota bacterium]MCC6891945.1 YciI family protein [Anaerolineae bacterium]